MIDIRITIEAALSILIEKMKIELKHRQRSGIIPPGLRLEDLNYAQLTKIIECSIFDTLFLLPIDMVLKDTNISYVITEAVKSLGRIYKKEEFSLFNIYLTKKIMKPVIKYLKEKINNSNFKYN